MARLIPIAVVAFVVVAGCSGLRVNRSMIQRPVDWTTYGGGPSRINSALSSPRPPFRDIWEYNAQAGVSGTPLVKDSIVVLGTLHGEIQAVNLTNGRRLGYKVLDGAIVGTPAWDGTRVILTMSGGQESVLSMDLARGDKAWSYDAGPVESSPLVFEDHVYVTALNGVLICLTKALGEEVWTYRDEDSPGAVRSSPATNGSVLCFGSDNGFVYGVERSGGRLIWKTDLGASVFASPVLSAGLVIVGTIEGVVKALDIASGGVRWSYNTGSRVFGSAAASSDAVFVGSADGAVHALDPATGSLRWKFRAASVISSAPLVSGGLVYVGSLDKKLYVLDAADGKEVWRFEAPGRIRVSPVLWGDFLLVTSEDKYVTALRPEEGQ